MKTSLHSLLPFFVLSAAIISAAEPAPEIKKDETRACCEPAQKPEVKKADACCTEEQEAAAYSLASIYQLDARYINDAGEPFALGDLRGRPVVLTMFFASCGYACPLLVSDMQRIREGLPAEVRKNAAFVLLSFDVVRDTPTALAAYRKERNLDDQFVLLHGDDAAVRELAALLGVKYKQEIDGSFAHSNLITILNPAGEIVHQRVGLQDGLAEAAAALTTAAN
jgi:protein SCO1/2